MGVVGWFAKSGLVIENTGEEAEDASIEFVQSYGCGGLHLVQEECIGSQPVLFGLLVMHKGVSIARLFCK